MAGETDTKARNQAALADLDTPRNPGGRYPIAETDRGPRPRMPNTTTKGWSPAVHSPTHAGQFAKHRVVGVQVVVGVVAVRMPILTRRDPAVLAGPLRNQRHDHDNDG